MVFFEFPIGNDDVGRRVDRVLRKFLKTTTLSIIYKNIRSGFIRINGSKIKSDYRTNAGDVVFIEKNFYESNNLDDTKSNSNAVIKSKVKFEIILENSFVKIINKPYGISVQPANKGDVSLDIIIQQEFIQSQKKGLHEQSLSFLPGPLHRLDKNTTGLLVFSQSLKGAQYFSDAMKQHRVKKQYLAILSGIVKEKCIWKHSISKKNVTNTNEFVTVDVKPMHSNFENGKHAMTEVQPLEYGTFLGESFTLASITIETGRTHQIRSQAAHMGNVLLGDVAYGYEGPAKSIFLHAWILEFPSDNEIDLPEKITAQIPDSFKNFIQEHLPYSSISSYNRV